MLVEGMQKVVGIIGNPVSHSLSPKLHGYWIKKYNVNGFYIPLKVKSEDLHDCMNGIRKMGFCGANVTIPYKESVFKYVDEASEIALKVGAINTLSIDLNGKITGTNTDVEGLLNNLKHIIPDWKKRVKKVLIIGAGGAARAAATAFQQEEIMIRRIVNRTSEKSYMIKEKIDEDLEVVEWNDINSVIDDIDLIINTTSLGMTGQPSLDIEISKMSKNGIVYDIVYSPLETNLIKSAKQNKIQCVGGLGMLVFQAVAGFNNWFGVRPEVDEDIKTYLIGS